MKKSHIAIVATGALIAATVIWNGNDTDRHLPPAGWGVINSAITQANIDQNICNPKWSTKSIRPPSSYTTALKIQQLKTMGYSDTKTADFEEDHLISLELGGSPTDPKNLWPESYLTSPYNARTKDFLENKLHQLVCSKIITLEQAQKEISTDWVKSYNKWVSTSSNAQGNALSDIKLGSSPSSPYPESYPSMSQDVDDPD